MIISSTEHGEYGVRTVRYYRSTNFSTEYGHYFLHQGREVRSTPGVQILARGTGIFTSTEYEEYEGYESSYERPWAYGKAILAHVQHKIKILKIFESLHIIWVWKSEKTFKLSFWADFGRESEKTLTLK